MLTGRFALLGLPIVVLTAALLIGTYRYVVLFNLQVSVEGVAGSMAQIFANTLWHDYRPLLQEGAGMGADAVRADPMTRALVREVRRATAGTKVVKIKVYTVNGFTLYSTDPAGAVAYYATLFGWQLHEIPMGPDNAYTIFRRDGADAVAATRSAPATSSLFRIAGGARSTSVASANSRSRASR